MKRIKRPHDKDGWYEITPLDAAEILSRMKLNRALRSVNVEKIAEEIKRGAWEQNGESMVFDADGVVLDGEHRLRACMVAGKPIVCYCVHGVKRSSFVTFDTGATRQAQDLASILKLSNYKYAAAIARWLIVYDSIADGGRWPTGTQARISQTTFGEYMHKHSAALEFAAAEAVKFRSGLERLGSVALFGGVFAIIRRVDPERSEKWLTLLATGEGLTEGHPVMLLRNRLFDVRSSKYKLSGYELAALCIKSFCLYRSGRRVKLLKWSSEEAFPRVEAAA